MKWISISTRITVYSSCIGQKETINYHHTWVIKMFKWFKFQNDYHHAYREAQNK